MSNYKQKEVMDYLTRKPVTTQDIELARTRIQTPVTPLPIQATSIEQPTQDKQIEMVTEDRTKLAEGTQSDYNALSNEARTAIARKRVIDFVNKFEKEKGRLPSQQEVRKLGSFDFETVKKAIKSGSVEVLPLNETKGQFTKIPVNNDLKILDQSKIIQDAFKSGKVPSLKDVQKVLKINDPTTAANRITQLASTYIEDMEVEGIKPKFKKTAQEILDTNPYDYKIRDIYEKSVAKSVGEKRTPSSIRSTTQRDLIPDVKGYSIDEPTGFTSSVRNRTTPYAVFSQIIDTEINRGDKYTFDSIKSKKETVLQNAIANGNKKEINKALNDFNKTVSEYEIKLNKNIKPGEKKIKLFKASLDAPENTIKNFDELPKQYQEAFTNNFNERGYSYQVPKDIKTVYQIGEDLKDPKIAEDVAKKAAKGQARIYSEFLPGTQAITSSVGDYLKGLALDVKAGKIVMPFLKVLGTAAIPLTVYDAYEGYVEGLPLDEVLLKGALGAEGISQTFKEQSALSPKAREAKQVLSSNTDLGMDSMGGMGYIQGPSTMTEEEAKKIYEPEAEAYAKKIKEENLKRTSERGKYAEYIKERFSPFSNEVPVEMAFGGRVKYAEGTQEDDLYIPPLNKDSEIDLSKEGLRGLYFGLKEEFKNFPIDPKTGELIKSGSTKELKQILSSLVSQKKPEIGFENERFNISASKGINPFESDRSIRYQASYQPNKDSGSFLIEKTPEYTSGGYDYNKDGLSYGISGLVDKMGNKNIQARIKYDFATGGIVKK